MSSKDNHVVLDITEYVKNNYSNLSEEEVYRVARVVQRIAYCSLGEFVYDVVFELFGIKAE